MTCSAAECICSKRSTCSCGAKQALECNCEKAPVENVVPPAEDACSCGKRTKDGCTCGAHGRCDGLREGETDFTSLK